MEILPLLCMIALTLFVVKCIIVMLKNHDDIYAFAFFVLYLYSIFAQVGYCYFPELSIAMDAYYGMEVYYKYYFVMFSSFISAFIFYKLYRRKTYKYKIYLKAKRLNIRHINRLFMVIYLIVFAILSSYYFTHRGEFTWGQNNSMGPSWYSLTFGFFNKAIFILYVHNRYSFSKIKTVIIVLSLLFFLQVAASAGNRSPILYYFIMFALFELYPFAVSIRKHKKKIILIGVMSFFLIQGLQLVLQLRTSTNQIGLSELKEARDASSDIEVAMYEKILLQDYYSPSHPLFIAIHKNYIDPLEVFITTICNSVYGIHHEYLTNTVVSLIGLKFERNEGWAFHYFIEGFIAVGFLAFLYNGFMLNILLRLLLWFTTTDNERANRFMIAIIAYLTTNLMRGQSSIFIREAIFTLIPVLLMYAYSYGYKVSVKKIR